MSRMQFENPRVRAFRELLGVGPQYSDRELKKAYHDLARLYHPDRNPDPQAVDQFQKIREAFDALSDHQEIEKLNSSHRREKLFDVIIEGLNISFGSLFGYRSFSMRSQRVDRKFRLGKEKAVETDSDREDYISDYKEQSESILDSPAFDAIETVYAGKFSPGDEERLQETFGQNANWGLPWIVLNNQGILHFLDGNFKQSKKCFEELTVRIPNNIMFLYRLGLCHIILGFQNPKRTLVGIKRPDRIEIDRGLEYLKHCVSLGEKRSVGRQKCLVVRKIIAEVLEATGRRKEALKYWQGIQEDSPRSVEAMLKLKGWDAARELLGMKYKKVQFARNQAKSGLKQIESTKRR